MKKEELRKVEFSHSMDGGYTYQTYEGYFHTWGLESVTSMTDGGNDQISNFTVAIIEEEDGTISSVNPSFVKFL